jgi:hypothetical protein
MMVYVDRWMHVLNIQVHVCPSVQVVLVFRWSYVQDFLVYRWSLYTGGLVNRWSCMCTGFPYIQVVLVIV